MKKIWANFTTFNYNIGYLRIYHTFMYFQIESNLIKGINMENWAFLQ